LQTLLVLAHPRRASLTGAVAEAFAAAIALRGHEVEWADLVQERFDPVLQPADEPDWNDPDKIYSPAVRAEMARIERNEATVMIFPVWWWSMPAVLKGWVDRVWNHGWAYGPRFYPHRRAWMIGIAGNAQEAYAARNYDSAMRIQLEVGLLQYCRVAEPRLELLYGAIEGDRYPPEILAQARALGAAF
jgi:NAD(P)H dehydrogenase (quinone)